RLQALQARDRTGAPPPRRARIHRRGIPHGGRRPERREAPRRAACDLPAAVRRARRPREGVREVSPLKAGPYGPAPAIAAARGRVTMVDAAIRSRTGPTDLRELPPIR